MQNNPDKATRSKKAAEGNIAGLNLLALDGMRVAMTPNGAHQRPRATGV
jgi:hypothetical protein